MADRGAKKPCFKEKQIAKKRTKKENEVERPAAMSNRKCENQKSNTFNNSKPHKV